MGKKIRVKTKEQLYIRYGAPTKSAPIKGELRPGFEFDVVRYDGADAEEIAGIKTWYVDGNGDYLWGGGLTVLTAQEDEAPAAYQGFIDYHARITKRYPALEGLTGHGVKVAVIDTGLLHKHPDFEGEVLTQHLIDCTQDPVQIGQATDEDGHGTHCAGLIGARSADRVGIRGVAPACTLYGLKVQKAGRQTIDVPSVKRALAWLLDTEAGRSVQVVNLSLSWSSSADQNLIAPLLEQCADRILFAAAGTNAWLKHTRLQYPANHKNMIAVGGARDTFNPDRVPLNSHLAFFMLLEQCYSTDTKHHGFYQKRQGASQITALLSGMACLLLEQTPQLSPAELVGRLRSFATPYQPTDHLKSLVLYHPKTD